MRAHARHSHTNDTRKRTRALRSSSVEARTIYDLPSAAIRCASRETFRRAALRCTILFCAARMITGSASAMAASARARSPAAIASSTWRTAVRKRERRARLTLVRRALCRAAFRADFVLGIGCDELCEAGLIGVLAGLVNAARNPIPPPNRSRPGSCRRGSGRSLEFVGARTEPPQPPVLPSCKSAPAVAEVPRLREWRSRVASGYGVGPRAPHAFPAG